MRQERNIENEMKCVSSHSFTSSTLNSCFYLGVASESYKSSDGTSISGNVKRWTPEKNPRKKPEQEKGKGPLSCYRSITRYSAHAVPQSFCSTLKSKIISLINSQFTNTTTHHTTNHKPQTTNGKSASYLGFYSLRQFIYKWNGGIEPYSRIPDQGIVFVEQFRVQQKNVDIVFDEISTGCLERVGLVARE